MENNSKVALEVANLVNKLSVWRFVAILVLVVIVVGLWKLPEVLAVVMK
jgi:Sec-independent protein translocase protein TatA